MTQAFTFILAVIQQSFTALNFTITLGSFSFGFINFLFSLFVIGILIRVFVKQAG